MNNLTNELTQYGLLVDNPPTLNGSIVRCKTRDSKSKKNGWYIGWTHLFKGKEYITCKYGDWSRDDKGHTFKSWLDDKALSQADLAVLQHQRQQAQRKLDAERIKAGQQAAQRAQRQWQALSQTGTSHYLERKAIKGFGIRYGKNSITVPLRDEQGHITSLQTIYDDGGKYFLPDGRIKACCHIIGAPFFNQPLCFAEGYATAASIHQATGFPVVVCFNAGNLEPVITRFKTDDTIKAAKFIVCADNDQWKPDKGNPGIEKATQAAKKHDCYLVSPDFTGLDITNHPTDFNDLHQLAGLEAVAKTITIKKAKPIRQHRYKPLGFNISGLRHTGGLAV
jgi:putative DNA primase/helicase